MKNLAMFGIFIAKCISKDNPNTAASGIIWFLAIYF